MRCDNSFASSIQNAMAIAIGNESNVSESNAIVKTETARVAENGQNATEWSGTLNHVNEEIVGTGKLTPT